MDCSRAARNLAPRRNASKMMTRHGGPGRSRPPARLGSLSSRSWRPFVSPLLWAYGEERIGKVSVGGFRLFSAPPSSPTINGPPRVSTSPGLTALAKGASPGFVSTDRRSFSSLVTAGHGLGTWRIHRTGRYRACLPGQCDYETECAGAGQGWGLGLGGRARRFL